MNKRNRWIGLWAASLMAAIAAASAGCAAIKSALPKMEDVSVQRRQRREETARDFNRHRDLAESEAARTSRLKGNVPRGGAPAAPMPSETAVSSRDSAPALLPWQPPSAAVALFADSGRAESAASWENAGRSEGRDPTHAEALVAEGTVSLAAGKLAEARASFQEAILLEPDNPQIPISAAVASLRHNQPGLAADLLEPKRLLKTSAGSAGVWRVLGAAYYCQGDFQASQAALEQALSLDKSSALSYFLMGLTLSKLGQPEAAEGHFRQAELLDPRYAQQRTSG